MQHITYCYYIIYYTESQGQLVMLESPRTRKSVCKDIKPDNIHMILNIDASVVSWTHPRVTKVVADHGFEFSG